MVFAFKLVDEEEDIELFWFCVDELFCVFELLLFLLFDVDIGVTFVKFVLFKWEWIEDVRSDTFVIEEPFTRSVLSKSMFFPFIFKLIVVLLAWFVVALNSDNIEAFIWFRVDEASIVSLMSVFDEDDDIVSSIVVLGAIVDVVVVSMDGGGAIGVVGLDSIRFEGLSVDLFLVISMVFRFVLNLYVQID